MALQNDKQFQMRVSDEFLKTLDEWRRQQDDLPPRAEAIRRLISAGMYEPLLLQLIAIATKAAESGVVLPGEADAIYRELMRIEQKEDLTSDLGLATLRLKKALVPVREPKVAGGLLGPRKRAVELD